MRRYSKEQLRAIHDYMRETTLKLNRKIEDLEARPASHCSPRHPPHSTLF